MIWLLPLIVIAVGFIVVYFVAIPYTRKNVAAAKKDLEEAKKRAENFRKKHPYVEVKHYNLQTKKDYYKITSRQRARLKTMNSVGNRIWIGYGMLSILSIAIAIMH